MRSFRALAALTTVLLAPAALAQLNTPPPGSHPVGSSAPEPTIRQVIGIDNAATPVGPAESPVPAASPIPVEPTPAPTPVAGNHSWTAPAPGEERNLVLPSFSGEPSTALGSPEIFRSLSPLQKAWFLREYYRLRGDQEGSGRALAVLIDLKTDLGLEDASAVATALVRESRERIEQGKAADALAAATAAVALAPDDPAAHTALARSQISNGAYGAAAGELEAGALAAWRNLRARVRLLGNLAVALLAGLLAAYAAFLVIALFRHGRYLAHDFRHALADNMPRGLAAIIFIPFLAFPLVFGLGVLPLLAWVTLVLWLQLSSRERVVAALFLLLGVGSPSLARHAAGFFAFEGGETGRLFAAVHEDEIAPRDLADLTSVADASGDPDLLLTLGNAHLRAGRYAVADGFYQRALEKGETASASVGLGVVKYAEGDVAAAIALWQKAIAADPNLFAAHYDLSRVYNERTELENANKEIAAARAIDSHAYDRVFGMGLPPERKAATESGTGLPVVAPAYVNRLLQTSIIPDEKLLSRAFGSPEAAAIARQSWRRVSPAIPLDGIPVVFGIALAFGGLLAATYRGVVPSRPCHRCGTRLCLRCDGPPLEDDLCAACYHAFIRTEGIDPRQRAMKEREVQDYQSGLKRRRTLLSVLVPGGGHLWGGDTVKGAILVVLASIAAVRLAAGPGWFRPRFPDGGAGSVAAPAFAAAVLLIAWIVGLRGHSGEGEPRWR